jgi:GNAT superfamily N-acetyltransferase
VNLSVRRYLPTDHAAVERIAAETAWFGQPVEKFVEDRRLFVDLVFQPYLMLAPGNIWLAVYELAVAGFVLGVPDTVMHRRNTLVSVMPRVAVRIARGKYHIGPRTRGYVRDLLRSVLRRERAEVDLRVYPAHLHINLLKDFRGQGGGSLLMQAFLAGMQQRGVPGVHLHTTDRNQAACRLYASLGFSLLDERPTTAWASTVPGPVRSRCYGIDLRLREAYMPL